MLVDQRVQFVVSIIALALTAALIGTYQATIFKRHLRELDEVAAQYAPLSQEEQQRELAAFRRRMLGGGCLIGVALVCIATPAALELALSLSSENVVVRWVSAAIVEVLALGWYAVTMRLAYWIGRERILRRRLIE